MEFSFTKKIEAGCDEAGRGCLAGAVFASSVILPTDFPYEQLNDSKKLTEKKRNSLREVIEKYAIWAVANVDNIEIEQINILQASITAMHRAIDKLPNLPEHLLIDGNKFTKYKDISHTCIIKGDAKYANIAAASILAKTHRDEYITKLHEQYPHYDWINNKGYPTKKHREAIRKYGITPIHRKTFKLIDSQQEISFNL